MLSGVRVFIVDDDPNLRALMRATLAAEPDVEVVGEAASGEEALDALARLDADVVVMDYAMPGLDGAQTTERLRGMACAADVLAWTSMDDRRVHRRFRLAGASAVYAKHALDELVGAIARRAATCA